MFYLPSRQDKTFIIITLQVLLDKAYKSTNLGPAKVIDHFPWIWSSGERFCPGIRSYSKCMVIRRKGERNEVIVKECARQTARNGHTISYTLVQYLCSYTLPDGVGNSLRASSPIWESEASRARTRARAGPPSPLARLLFTISPNGELARRLGWKLVDGWPAAKFPSWGLLLLSLLSFCFLVSLSCLIPSRFL